eukprot:9105436-Pyramimonas_sp.AAC.2
MKSLYVPCSQHAVSTGSCKTLKNRTIVWITPEGEGRFPVPSERLPLSQVHCFPLSTYWVFVKWFNSQNNEIIMHIPSTISYDAPELPAHSSGTPLERLRDFAKRELSAPESTFELLAGPPSPEHASRRFSRGSPKRGTRGHQ